MKAQESGHGSNGRGNRAATTHRLLEAAATEFVERGYDSARVSDIARSAGVTVGSIYARWSTKTEMMVAALDHILDQILPEQRFESLGLSLDDLSLPDLVLLWGADLMEPSSPREVFTQVFGSAQNNPEVQARLKQYLNESFVQILRLVERAKEEGHVDPEVSTAAVALTLQAVGVGVHLIRSGGLDEDYVPSTSDWTACMERYFGGVHPPEAD
ncbi:TetR/AcrR family transcriptional regulator [Candidatus Poriferisocius sp.]|uniref:TetR/AcrR family transcriptional regulator n=1 Tax=Candidatus Poriferisocius sp. TaxID=3101276 RepID=UPI003B010A24